MSDVHELAQRLMALDDRLIACMKCGNCQAVCPMFGASGMEADVARGKLALIDNLAHEILRDPAALADKLGALPALWLLSGCLPARRQNHGHFYGSPRAGP